VEQIATIFREWAAAAAPRKLAVTLEHQYTPEGLAWDALKGMDRARARALLEGARPAGCQALLGLLTLHQCGSAEGDWDYGRRGRWYEEDEEPNLYEMGEIYETSLTAENWIDANGKRLKLGPLDVEEGEVLDPEAIKNVEPEEKFEGYTGNEGMTLDRWYRHAAVFLWPKKRHFDIFCDAGSWDAVEALGPLVNRWQQAGKKAAADLRADCIDFASTIIAQWPEKPSTGHPTEKAEACPLFRSLAALGEPGLLRAYLGEVLPRDATVDPGKSLAAVCQEHGWETFRQALEAAFQRTTGETLERNVRLLESLCLARPRKKTGWSDLCHALGRTLVEALERIDRENAPPRDWWRPRTAPRAEVLAGLARSLLATDQGELLSRVVGHALANPEKYPLTDAHLAALTALAPWLKKNLDRPCPALSHWLAACRQQLEALTAKVPQPPADYRRDAPVSCKCADCAEVKRFLVDPHEPVLHFRAAEPRRRHVEAHIHQCDLDLRTERKGSPHTLVCTKNTASYNEKLRKFHQDQQHLAAVRSIEAALPQ
jgi:hypothetical protein